MPLRPENVSAHEWIGLHCKVITSADPNRLGLAGRIVNETKNTVVIETKKGEKVLPKQEVELEIKIENQKVVLKTKNWCMAPENRVKAFFKSKKTVNKR